MAKFIQLTYPDNTETWVNVEHIVTFEANMSTQLTDVILMGFGTTSVKETPRQISLSILTS